jgi:hypothetical protein
MDEHAFASQERVGDQAGELLEGRQDRAFSQLGSDEAVPVWRTNLPVPIRGLDVGRDVDHEADEDPAEELKSLARK